MPHRRACGPYIPLTCPRSSFVQDGNSRLCGCKLQRFQTRFEQIARIFSIEFFQKYTDALTELFLKYEGEFTEVE